MSHPLTNALANITATVERVYKGFFAINCYTIDHPDFRAPLTREVFSRGPAACVLVYDPKIDRVLLVEEFRIGNHDAGYVGQDAISAGPIAGMIEEGQDGLATAMREAAEEAGVDLTHATVYGPLSTLPSPGGSSEVLHHYVAVADLSGVVDGARFGLIEEGESTRTYARPRASLNPLQMGTGRVPANGLLVTTMFMLTELILRGVIVPNQGKGAPAQD